MSRRLAERLDEASQILYGLNELLDQLPDAVILTDRDGKILEWNRAAERLYGRGWDKMSHRSAEEIYEDPQAYREFLVEVQEKWEARERTLKTRHPQKGILYVATSMTVLYDAHHNFQGVLSLGRDVTAAQNLEKRYRRIRTWLYPILAVLLFLAVGGIVSYPYLEKTYFAVAPEKKRLLDQLYEDYEQFSLKLAPHFRKGDPTAVEIMKAYFQESSYIPYTGFVILDEDKTVLNAYSRRDDEKARRLIGSSYRGIQFKGDHDALQRVLSVFHIDKEHPMGRKSLEVAFEIMAQGKAKGWLIFQMDTDLLKEKGLDEEELREFDFENR
jgi:PAS domain S-box-containing protein